MLDKDAIAEITPGVHTRDNVTQVLGTPSSVASFDKNIWYYIGGQTERIAFFKPEILEQQVVAIKFDESGTVSEIRKYTLQDGKEVEMVERETPTRGRELSFMRSFLGSIGLLSRDVLNSEPGYRGTGRGN
ncbi:MAG: outer membrane protein assembly factor BamE [Alphaproteobacteria bacterium]